MSVSIKTPAGLGRIIPAIGDHISENAEVKIEGANDLYSEVRIENQLIDAEGNPVKLKKVPNWT